MGSVFVNGEEQERSGQTEKPPTKKVKRESNPERWSRLAGEAKAALEELEEMRQEYGDKYDNMNEGLQASAYGQKCEAMQNLDLQSAIDACDEAEATEVPLGFGRD